MNQGLVPAKWAALTPRNEAVIDVPNNRRLTYAEFDGLVRRLANGLRGLGLEKGDRFGVLSRNCAEFMALYFAAGRAGLVLQPLNWRLAGEELATIVRDASPRVIISQDEFGEAIEQLQRDVDVPNWLQFGDKSDGSFTRFVEAASDDEPLWVASVGDDDPFFILYTGGTTGKSKGAMHTHRSAGAMMLAQTVAERIVPTDVYMLTGQMYHIPIVLAMNYNRHGCPLVLVNFEAKQALEVIQEEKVSAFLGITTMINWMMAVPDFASYDLSSLRNFQYGGGPMPSSVVRAAMDNFPCTMIQGYGQTEGAGMTFLSQEDHVNAVNGIHPERLRSCGREGFTAQIRVVDERGDDVPRDGKTAGQIVVRGEQNMIGYLNQPELTAQTIHDGWMWTGDMATWDSDRYIFIVDRAKDMIISGGENIYSVQVEEAINQHPAVLECAVFGVPDDEWGETVKAVVVLKPGKTASEQEIIDEAKKHLASYQKPRSVDFVGELPKAPTGKILKRELRNPYWAERDRGV
jgi:acyl-CoA synthetase (AMP-forming)/AMP-acid ligase II